MAWVGGCPVGKKPVIRLLGLNGAGGGNSVDVARLLGRSVDSEKVAGKRDVVRGRHCARVTVWLVVGVGSSEDGCLLCECRGEKVDGLENQTVR